MSRIHDALKKADQERASAQEGAPSGVAAAPVSEVPAYADVELAPVAANLGMPELGGPSSLESLLTTCRYTEWKPDLEIMLFMNGNERATSRCIFEDLGREPRQTSAKCVASSDRS